jgi:hypothetical protein
MISLEKHSVNRSFFAFRSGAATVVTPLFFCLYSNPGVIISGFFDGGGVHLRISGFQIRKHYYNH